MSASLRFIFITCLIYLLYGFWIFSDTGSIIFPFPLNEYVFLIGLIAFSRSPGKLNKWHLTLFLLLGIAGVLKTEYFYAFFLDSEQMLVLSESIITDVFQLCYYVILIIAMAFYIVDNKKIGTVVGFGAVLIFGLIFLIFNLQALWFILMAITWIWSNATKATDRLKDLWLLMAVLNLFFCLSFLLNA